MLIDSLLKAEFRYEIYLCKPSDYTIIACLTECTIDRTIKRQLKSIDELEFIIPRYWSDSENSVNAYFDSVISGSVILVESLIDDVVQERLYFKVIESELVIDEREYKAVKCYSLQYQWSKIKIKNFTTTVELSSTTQLYDPNNSWDNNDPSASGIINYILEVVLLNTWSVNYISTSLLGLYRTFDISESSLLEVVENIQNNFNCVIIFDTYNRQLDILDYAELPTETGLILHDEGFINKLQQKIKIDEIVTRLYIDGDNDPETSAPRTIISKNITQQPYIDNFTYFRNSTYMSSGLLAALTALDVKLSAGTSTFNGYLSDLSTLQGELTILQGELAALQTNLEIYEAKEDGAIKYGGNYDGHTYSYWHGLLTTQQGLITSKNGAITSKNEAITTKQNQISALAYTVSYENPANFTTAQLQELLNFINMETAKCSSSDPTELMSFGAALLSRKANPPIEFELDIVDLFDSKELSYTWDKLTLGAKVDLVSDTFSISESPRVVSYTHNPDKCTLSATVSNKEYVNSDLDYITALFAKSKQGADTIKNERDIYKDYVVNDKDVLNDFIISPIDPSINNINMNDGSYINRRGLYMKDVDSDLGQMKILGNRIVFTQNNWTNYSLAITSSGIQTDGSFKLFSENKYGDNNLVTIDGNGIKIYGDGTTTNCIEIFNKNNVKTFGLDSNGSVVMSGTITITGGSGIGSLTDAGTLATADNLDEVPNGSTYYKTTSNQVTGAGRAYSALDTNNDVVSRVKPSTTMGNPAVAGLYMGSDYLGFHNGNGQASGWTAYIKNDGGVGKFKFSGDASNFIEWTGSALNIRGALNASDITAGTLSASYINTSGLASEKIYKAGTPSNYAVIGGTYSDMVLYYNNSEYFRIYNDLNTIVDFKFTTYAYGEKTAFSTNGNTTYPKNNWDFTSATVSNLTVKFS